MRKLVALTLALLLLLVVAPGAAQDDEEATVYDVISGREDLSTLKMIIDSADPGVVEVLSDPDAQLTLFAPTNEAFETAFSDMGLDQAALLEAPTDLAMILAHHTVPMFLTTEEFSEFNDEIYLGTLMPNWPLVYFSDGIGSGNDFGKFVETDIIAWNGAIHIIDSVLPPDLELMRDYYREVNEDYDSTMMRIIFDAANSDDPTYTILTQLVTQSDDAFIYNFLDGIPGVGSAYTIFAPTDAAFEAIFEELGFSGAEEALQDPDELSFVLGYHILPGNYASEYLLCQECHEEGGFEAVTVSGIPVAFTWDDDTVLINGIPVIAVDQFGFNGVIHTIESVLLP